MAAPGSAIKTTTLKNGSFRHDIHYWLGKDTSQDEAGTAAIKTVELDAALGGRAVQYREVQGNETEKFLSSFKPCIIPEEGGVASGFRHTEINEREHKTRLFVCRGKHTVHVKEELLREGNRPKSHIIRLMEGFETVIFRSKFDKWPKKADAVVSDESRGKVAALLKRQGFNFKGPAKAAPVKQEPLPQIDCTGNLQVREIFNFAQDDLMTEDIFILDCHSCIFVWVGQRVDTKIRAQALNIGEKFLELDILMENVSRETPLYVITEGSEPQYFTRFFTWDFSKSAMHGNSFERKLSIVRDGVKPRADKPKRRPTTSAHTGRSSVPDKSQRSRSMSFSPDRVRVRGRSPAFNALAANFENPNARNLSTPPPVVRKQPLKPVSPDSSKPPPRTSSIAAISASFERPKATLIPKSIKASPDSNKPQTESSKPKPETNAKEINPTEDSQIATPAVQEDVKESQVEGEEGLPVYPYDRLRTSSTNPATDIDVTKREIYLSSSEFRERFGMTKEAFAKLPKWKQNRLKIALQLF
nr:unnamed protein product [Digitaria exilis]